jgi:SAM-dependent methyltransferase
MISMPGSSDEDENPSSETAKFRSGQALIEWIGNTPDFPLAEAHSINRRSWSDEGSRRFKRFDIEAETGGIRGFFENPRISVEGPLLDIACSTGHNLAFFQKQGIRPLYGIDISLPLLKLAKKRLPRVHVQQADMVALPFRSSFFKVVIARGAFHNTTTTGFLNALMEIRRVLRDDGIVFLRRRYRPNASDRYTHFALHTYVKLDAEGKPAVVRNFIPLRQMQALVESAGFKAVGGQPIRVIEKSRNLVKAGREGAHLRPDRGGKRRFIVEFICLKRAVS